MLIGIFACKKSNDEVVKEPVTEPVGSIKKGELVKQSKTFDNLTRNWMEYIPKSYDGIKNLPMVISLHGGGGRGDLIADDNGWKEKAEKEGFIVVFPDGAIPNGPYGGFNWNIFSWNTAPNDVSFLLSLINHLKTSYKIDSKKVFMTGHSNGASMTNTFAFVHAKELAAIAPAQGSFMTSLGIDPYTNPQQPNAPIPVWIWRGDKETQKVPTAIETRTVSDENQRQYWVNFNQANPTPLILNQTDGQKNYTTKVYNPGKAEVRFTEVADNFHEYLPNFTNKIWDEFFVRFTRD